MTNSIFLLSEMKQKLSKMILIDFAHSSSMLPKVLRSKFVGVLVS